ncbi:LOW QUALITY PROTEIN: hypothetical protein HID58_065701 [Brassica napus]|uniref:Uncharacterized protein n=1 Tax=Brassica napus TaxID=3708 RepID=A0ABQ7ZDL2_BRANA|nr:LOW QUALITY PROTEIN: hypothetical protein HID58_065701 [Brassica napus]
MGNGSARPNPHRVRNTCPTVEAPPNFAGRKVISGVSNRHVSPETYRKHEPGVKDSANNEKKAKIRKLENKSGMNPEPSRPKPPEKKVARQSQKPVTTS